MGRGSDGIFFPPPAFAELPADGKIGRKRHGRKSVQGEKANRCGIGAGPHRSCRSLPPKPDAHRLAGSVVKVGMNGEHRADGHRKSGFLPELPYGRRPDLLIPLDMAAGDAPQPLAGAAAADQKQAVRLEQDHRDADGGVAVKGLSAGRTAPALVPAVAAARQRRPAERAEPKKARTGCHSISFPSAPGPCPSGWSDGRSPSPRATRRASVPRAHRFPRRAPRRV